GHPLAAFGTLAHALKRVAGPAPQQRVGADRIAAVAQKAVERVSLLGPAGVEEERLPRLLGDLPAAGDRLRRDVQRLGPAIGFAELLDEDPADHRADALHREHVAQDLDDLLAHFLGYHGIAGLV